MRSLKYKPIPPQKRFKVYSLPLSAQDKSIYSEALFQFVLKKFSE